VEPELTLAECSDRLAVDLDVGDEQNLLIVLLGAFSAVAQGSGARLRSPRVPK
jgi:hypothetical protein